MNETHANAVIASLEGQRNSALNTLVHTEAALTVARARNSELEKALAAAMAPKEDQPVVA